MAERMKREVRMDFTTGGVAQADKGIATIGQRLKELNQAAQAKGLSGETSVFGLLKGAGIAAGGMMVANSFRQIAEAADGLSSGSLTARESLLGFADAIPIIGSVARAFDAMDASSRRAEASMKLAAATAKRNAEQNRQTAQALAEAGRAAVRAEEAATTKFPIMTEARHRWETAQERIAARKGEVTRKFGFTSFQHAQDADLREALPADLREAAREAVEGVLAEERMAVNEWNASLKRFREADAQRRRQSSALGGRIFAGVRGVAGRAAGGIGAFVGGAVAGAFDAGDREAEAQATLRRMEIAEAERKNNDVLAQRLRLLEEERQRAKELVDIASDPSLSAETRAGARRQLESLDPQIKSIAESSLKTQAAVETMVDYLKSLLGNPATDPVSAGIYGPVP